MNLIQCIQKPEAKGGIFLLFYFSLSVATVWFLNAPLLIRQNEASSKFDVIYTLFLFIQFTLYVPGSQTLFLLNLRLAQQDISNTTANKWILKNTSLYQSSHSVLLFLNMSFPAELCNWRKVSLWRSYSWNSFSHGICCRNTLQEGLCGKHEFGSFLPGGTARASAQYRES